MIEASRAKTIADSVNNRDAWQVLEERIKEKALLGKYSFIYDEENEGAKFKEAPKEVRKILEEAGYTVKYNRCADFWADPFTTPTYHGKYKIGWRKYE